MMSAENLIDDLHRVISMKDKQLGRLKSEVQVLKKDLDVYQRLIRGQPIPVEYQRYDPEKFKQIIDLIKRGAILLTKERGGYWKDRELYDWLCRHHRERNWNLKTVARQCQLAAKDGFLTRTAPATYIYYVP